MSTLPLECYRVKQIREIEQLAIAAGISEEQMMLRAATAALEALLEYYPECTSITVFCGGGNNGGDGYVLASLALEHDIDAQVFSVYPVEKLQGVAKEAAEAAEEAGVCITPWEPDIDFDADVIFDAMLGIGVEGEVRDPIPEVIAGLNESDIPLIALDIPSGIDADTGKILGTALAVDLTVTFIGLKQGLLTGAARRCCGEIIVETLDLDDDLFAEVPLTALRSDLTDAELLLTPRPADSYKGDFGHVLVIGGDHGMAGAAIMAAEAAARSGAGLTTVATRPEHVAAVVTHRPEVMCYGIKKASELAPLMERATVIVLGPGLGTSEWSEKCYQAGIESHTPMVIDASALHYVQKYPPKNTNIILTPHPGEAANLLQCTTREIQNDRFAAAVNLQKQYGGVIVLKGAGTIIQTSEESPEICAAGNPGMATGGMGDVLSGMIAGLLAQKLSLYDAARVGVLIHAHAADLAAGEEGERGLLATDILSYARKLLNPWQELSNENLYGDENNTEYEYDLDDDDDDDFDDDDDDDDNDFKQN